LNQTPPLSLHFSTPSHPNKNQSPKWKRPKCSWWNQRNENVFKC
jgi:hypothetical protein